ncbi:ABC-2 type transporter [Ostertagia ostertagi]
MLSKRQVIAALTGIVYLGDSYTQDKVANINGSLYQLVMNMAFMFQFVVVNHFCSEISTFYREYSSGLYSVPAYFLAKNLAELPTYTLAAVIFGTILYWMSRLFPLWDAFGFYLLIAVLVQNTAISIGMLIHLHQNKEFGSHEMKKSDFKSQQIRSSGDVAIEPLIYR